MAAGEERAAGYLQIIRMRKTKKKKSKPQKDSTRINYKKKRR